MSVSTASQRTSVAILSQRFSLARSEAVNAFNDLITNIGNKEQKIEGIQTNVRKMELIFEEAQTRQQELQDSLENLGQTKEYKCLSLVDKMFFGIGIASICIGAFSGLPVPFLKEVGVVLTVASKGFSTYKEKLEKEIKKEERQFREKA